MEAIFEKSKRALLLFSFLLLAGLLLTRSSVCVKLAGNGLRLWFENMIPVLLPFMILSGTLIRMNLSEGFVFLIYPFLNHVFHISRNACYVMAMGFMCGFPMGAKCIAELYGTGRLSRREASLLLAFCNNIGPLYLLGFALPLLKISDFKMVFLGMYGIPLLYGLILRYTIYAGKETRQYLPVEQMHAPNLFACLNASIAASIQSILMLGGYMILFNLLMIVPMVISGQMSGLMAPLFEISGGLMILQNRHLCAALCYLQFGGLSCIAQTYHCIQDTDLSILEYVVHKLVLAILTFLFYKIYFGCLLPFLRPL